MSTYPNQSRRAPRIAAVLAFATALAVALPASAAPPGFTTSAPPYVVPNATGVTTSPILTVGDAVPEADAAVDTVDPGGAQDGLYRMVGVPDGLGAFRNGQGTFTVLMNHELGPTFGAVRDHGSTGAFVSRWVLRTSDFSVVSGDDQIKAVFMANATGGGWSGPGTFAFDRLCSADLPAQTALFNPGTGRGTQELIYLNGEEARPPFGTRFGKAFAHILTGDRNGESYELNDLGEMSFENVVASPFPQDKTVVFGLDDATNTFDNTDPFNPASPPSEVYVYVGEKSATGNPVQRAGLVGGDLFGIRVPGKATEDSVANGDAFELVAMSEPAQDDGSVLQNQSITAGITQFRRVEDGQWDPSSPNDFYFVTTDAFAGVTSVWRLRFSDVTDPESGGRIDRVYGASAGHTEAGAATEPETAPGEMFDNMTVDVAGRVLLQEDTGNNAHLSRVWALNPDTGRIGELAIHNPALFSGTPPVKTLDEESSGIIDISHIVGRTTYLLDVQAHRALADPELVEDGQLLAMTVKFNKVRDQSGALVFP